MVFGPIHPKLQTLDSLNTSNQRIRDMMLGKLQDEIPPAGIYIWVDVRDLALAHIRAAERPAAAGQRFLVTAGYYSNRELADDIRDQLPDVASKISTKGGEFPEGGMSLILAPFPGFMPNSVEKLLLTRFMQATLSTIIRERKTS